MIRVLDLAAFGEMATGLALVVAPSLVGQVLLGELLTGPAVPTARVAGIALIALGVACWKNSGLIGMLIYSAAVTLYLAWFGLTDGSTGVLLWPAIAVHAVLSVLLWRGRHTPGAG
ncbi:MULTISPECIES: hypothetical protein [unclassified Ensifer]|uniref:hypothetical protein n=1 Tax=unclassified Ensifer TaxID=2633371 RepID=UPI00088007E6|nr:MULTISPECIES: hypothetical protein [unclassified Ensifer]MBD9591669.1 hypothetical protein [Ensifer sp. ENS05]SDL25152.1 hypothetical protein SAMN05216328_101476 [Ensifer sp. YR511]